MHDLHDINTSTAGVIRWTSRTPRDYACERIPEIASKLPPCNYFTFEVGEVPYTLPGEGPALAALPADEITEGRVNAIVDLFAEEVGGVSFALVPVETSPTINDDGEVAFRSFERFRLEENAALPRAVVAALDPTRIYSLYGIFGHHDGHGAPVEFVDNNPAPQPLKDHRKRLVEQFLGSMVKADSLYGIDATRWEKARGYLAVIRWRLTPIPVATGPMGPFHAGDLGSCVLKVVRETFARGVAAENQGRGFKPAGKKLVSLAPT